jgi:2-hydroxychromene-2-carboxylate isomerase
MTESGASTPGGSTAPVFYFDLGSPYAYLAAERIERVFDDAGAPQPEWQPILLGGLFRRFDRGSWARTPEREAGLAEVERRAQAYGLPPIRWPEPFPGDMLFAMRTATFAKEIGRAVSFALAAFRQAFAAGRDLSEPDNVFIAAASSELHPRSLEVAVQRQAIKDRLREATDRAGDLGVVGVPAVIAGGEVFWGDDRLEEAAVTAAAEAGNAHN